MQSDLLFVQPTFWRGFGRTLDLWGDFDTYNDSLSPDEADRLALASDLYMIGIDLRAVIEQTVIEAETTSNEENQDLALS